MRGVYLTPGAHTTEFRFEPPYRTLYVSLAAVAMGVAILGYCGLSGRRKEVRVEPAKFLVSEPPKPAKQQQKAGRQKTGRKG